jgi:hypothetical protein
MALVLAACDKGQGEGPAQALPTATTSASPGSDVPTGFIMRQGAGFSIAVPADWVPRPENMRLKQAAMDIGVPFTGQPYPPPRLLAFLERDLVGPLNVREPILRAQLQGQLAANATLGAAEHVKIKGADDAIEFEVTYTTAASTSVLDTPLEATDMRQIELLVETEGLPKFGFRFSAPAAQFDKATWQTIRDSITVRPQDVRNSGDPSPTPST